LEGLFHLRYNPQWLPFVFCQLLLPFDLSPSSSFFALMKLIPLFVLLLICNGTFAQAYFLNGDAIAIGEDCYQLTTEATFQNGTVWYAEQISVGYFDIQFTMNFGDMDATGADGMCFVLQTVGTDAIGESGGGMGYLNFDNSFAIEFDTWQNTEYGDPPYDHIAMEQDGEINHNTPLGNIAAPVQMDAFDPNAEDGEDHVVRITCDQSTGEIAVYFDCELRLTATVNLVANVFDGGSNVYWGFTGATGGSFNMQTVCLSENIIATGPNVSICTGASTQLSVAGNANGTYLWTPSDFLDDPSSATPIANPPVTTTYTVEFSDLCGNQLTDSITVTVEDLEVSLPETSYLTCDEPLIFLTAVSNFFNNLNYLWSTTDGELGAGQGTENMAINTPGTYTISINYDSQCFAGDQTVVVGNYQFEVGTEVASLINCINETTTITASSGLPGSTFSWTTNDGNIVSGSNAAIITVDAPGTYTVQGYLNEFCSGGMSVEVIADFSTYTADAGADVTLNCYSDEINLEGISDGNNALINWTTADGNIINGNNDLNPLVNENGTYTLTVTQPASGCTTSDATEVTSDFAAPQLNIPLQDTLNCITPSIEIFGVSVIPSDGDYSFQWSTDNGEISSGGNTSSPTVAAEGEYSVVVSNVENGCVGSSEVNIVESDEFDIDLTQLRFPNIISPNTDGNNDLWQPFLANDREFDATQIFSDYVLKIFNRWGALIFESDANTRKWTDREIASGTYYYILLYSSGCGTGAAGEISGYVQVVK